MSSAAGSLRPTSWDRPSSADIDALVAFLGALTDPCLQLSGEQLISELAIAWHSDGKTYGYTPGEFSADTHVQMYVTLPKHAGL